MDEIYDGIRIHFLENDKFNTACIAVILRRELSREEVTSNALLTRVLSSGCQKYKNITEINEKLDNMLGAAFNADVIKKGSEQLIEFFCEVYDNKSYVIQALDFIGEILFNPKTEDKSFSKDTVENEKNKLRNIILSRKDNKKEYAKERMIEEMCKDNAFGIYGGGYEEDIEKLNEFNLYEHYENILKTSPIEILIMSNVRKRKISDKCFDLFSIKNRNVKYPKKQLKITSSETKTIKDKESGISQGKLCIGLKSGIKPDTENFFPLLMGNEILGGSGNSKLFMKIREKENLCYYINSFIYRFSGIICIQSGVNEDNFDKTISLIKEQIEAVKSGDFSENDIENAKKSLVKSILSTKDYNNSLMDYYLTNLLINENEKISKVIRTIKRTDKDDILDAFKNVSVDTIYMMGAK